MYQLRNRKRVHAIRRGPDGSAFQNCGYCGVSVAIALADMHECEPKRNVKRFKGQYGLQNSIEQRFPDQPRSEFCFFMESFMKTCKDLNEVDVHRKGFETWTNMSKEERQPYVLQARKVNSAYTKALLELVDDMSGVDDEADSAEVGKFDENYEDYEYYDDSECSESFYSETSERLETYPRAMVAPWTLGKSS